ncbi:unnamed protein product, partial [Symbiodinium sp. KB8]
MAMTPKAGRDSLPLAPSGRPAKAPPTPKKAAFRPPPPLQPPFRDELPTAPVAKAPVVDANKELVVKLRAEKEALLEENKRFVHRLREAEGEVQTVGKKTETGMTLVAAMIAIAEMTVIAGTTETAARPPEAPSLRLRAILLLPDSAPPHPAEEGVPRGGTARPIRGLQPHVSIYDNAEADDDEEWDEPGPPRPLRRDVPPRTRVDDDLWQLLTSQLLQLK